MMKSSAKNGKIIFTKFMESGLANKRILTLIKI
jgi:hypothetical protein